MNILTLTVGDLSTNCYVVSDEAKNAVVIDPGDEADRILSEAAARDLTIRAILLTHLHIDHFAAVPPLAAATGAALVIPRREEPAVHDEQRSLLAWLPLARLRDMEEALRLFPGHGEPTTLDTERRFNPYLK